MSEFPNSLEKTAVKAWNVFKAYKKVMYFGTAALLFVFGYYTAELYSVIYFDKVFSVLFLEEPMKGITDLEGRFCDKLLLSIIVWLAVYTSLFFIVTDSKIEQKHFELLSPIKSLLNIVHKYLLLILVFILGFSFWIYFDGLNIAINILLMSGLTFGLPCLGFLSITKLVNYDLMKKQEKYRYSILILLLLLISAFSIWYSYLSVSGFFEKLDSWIKLAESLGHL